MFNPFQAVINFFARLFSKKTLNDINAALIAAGPYVQTAMPIVEQIAALTPNRTDDEIVAAYKHYGLGGLFDATKDKAVLLRDLAAQVVGDTVKDPAKKSVINLAIEVAVNALKVQQ